MTNARLFIIADDFFSHKLSFNSVFTLTHLIVAGVAAFMLGSLSVLCVIYMNVRSKSAASAKQPPLSTLGSMNTKSSSSSSSSSCCCCFRKKSNRNGVTRHGLVIGGSNGSGGKLRGLSERHLSSSLDHNSLETDTAGTDVLNMMQCSGSSSGGGDTTGKYCSTASEASSNNSAGSQQSKEYFTIGKFATLFK